MNSVTLSLAWCCRRSSKKVLTVSDTSVQSLACAAASLAWVSNPLYGEVVYRMRVPRLARCVWAMFFMCCATEVLEYVKLDVYSDGSVHGRSAPFTRYAP